MTSAAPSSPTCSPPLRIYLHASLQQHSSSSASYYTRRLHRLRHTQPVKKHLVHSKSYKSSVGTKAVPPISNDSSSKSKSVIGATNKSKHSHRGIDMKLFPVELLASHENFFLDPLVCAERCWVAVQEMKAEQQQNAEMDGGGIDVGKKKNKSPGKFRREILRKLKKAVTYAELLEELTTKSAEKEARMDEGEDQAEKIISPVDDHTRMEAKAYASWMRGNLAMERKDWTTACREYQVAFTLCENIANQNNVSCESGGDNNGELTKMNELQRLELYDLFTTRANNVIAPLLRYCIYEMKEIGASPTEEVETNQGSSSITLPGPSHGVHSIVFRENTIVVETKDIKMALLKVHDLKKEWEEEVTSKTEKSNDDSKLMTLLNGYDEITTLANRELKPLVTVKAGPAVKSKIFQLVNVIGYAKYQKLKLVMERNEAMANEILKKHDGVGASGKIKKRQISLKQLEEVTHLYDALLQDARAVASLPGGGSVDELQSDATSTSVEDEFLLEANANILRIRSLRCFYLARMHASPLVNKYSEAITLLDQAELLAREALEEIGACDQMVNREVMLDRLTSVIDELKGEKCRVWAMAHLSKSSSLKSSLPLLSRLHSYALPDAPTYITNVPPKLEPITCKPSFFDVALNYVDEYPIEELERVFGDGEDRTGGGISSGILGWFRRG